MIQFFSNASFADTLSEYQDLIPRVVDRAGFTPLAVNVAVLTNLIFELQ